MADFCVEEIEKEIPAMHPRSAEDPGGALCEWFKDNTSAPA